MEESPLKFSISAHTNVGNLESVPLKYIEDLGNILIFFFPLIKTCLPSTDTVESTLNITSA